ncbi:cysteine--tRNA ligase [Candidatus Uhrbacteria bacterium]|nr:cysteine--tRNA ligase [Candidatus Uhrbacteria bacterium]
MLKLYDSLRRKKVTFRPLKAGQVSMYNCGPTVYGNVHIGNLRAFVFADLLRRHLERSGYAVTQIMNITDVGHVLADADEGEDKMEAAARKEGKTPGEIALFFTEAFFADIRDMNIRPASAYPKASEHVPEMVEMIGRLIENGSAYKVPSGDGQGHSVYFDISAFPDYGKLSGNRIDGLNPGARVDVRPEKKHPADFALWVHNPRHLMQWEAPWGRGYPGWHVECSAMAIKYLGQTIDIHTGGEDNRFPHHECEIAQSECFTGQPFARFWLHVTHLMVEGEKMSKSRGNFLTLRDLKGKGYRSREVRYLLLSAQYRQPFNFTMAGLDGARSALSKLDDFADSVRSWEPKSTGRSTAFVRRATGDFVRSLDDDLNVPEALAAVFGLVSETNRRMADGSLTSMERQAVTDFLESLGNVMGFSFGTAVDDRDIPQSVALMIEKREKARSDRRFAEADAIRDEILARGFVVEDTPDGRRVKRV